MEKINDSRRSLIKFYGGKPQYLGGKLYKTGDRRVEYLGLVYEIQRLGIINLLIT